MASSFADDEPIRDIEFYKALAQRDLELIESQQAEISKLKSDLNQANQARHSLARKMMKLKEGM